MEKINRREFIILSGMGLFATSCGMTGKEEKYSVVILGDTHFDTEPASVYHSHYDEKVEWLNRVQRAEFVRNGEMWRERCPRLLKRAASLVSSDTQMAFQMGDLIQGDCGNGEVHKKMLDDVMNRFKGEFAGLPFVTVVGNHDIRGTDAEKAYLDYMTVRMGNELGKEIRKTTFSFNIGSDAYIVVDFNTPDDSEVEKLLANANGARHTFVIVHGPVFPLDGGSCRWFFHGGASEADTTARRHFRRLFAKRKVVVLCGHTHCTELADWYGDGGRITQMTMNSVWSNEKKGRYEIDAQGAAEYGVLRKKLASMPNGSEVKDETALFDEYRDGLKRYIHSPAAGAYKLFVSDNKISVDFHAGDSPSVSEKFVLRGDV